MKNKVSIVSLILCVVICFLLMTVIYLINNPLIVIEEKEVIVEVEKEKIIEVVVEKEVVVEVEVEKEPEYTYNITSEEREMLARLVYREANTESVECQRAVVSVVINRWLSGIWGDTLENVVYAPNQFSPANLIYCTTPTEQNYDAVDYVIKNGITIPKYIMYFRADYHFSFNNYCSYKKIDDVCFGYMQKDKENLK